MNAATLALVDAGIPMIEYAVACSASLANGGIPLVDISHLEESSGGPNLTVVALPLSEQVSWPFAAHICRVEFSLFVFIWIFFYILKMRSFLKQWLYIGEIFITSTSCGGLGLSGLDEPTDLLLA